MARASSPLLFLLPVAILLTSATSSLEPEAAPWPPQFHSVLFANLSGEISLIDLWYDLPNGRNFNIIRKQLGELLYDVEWDNGTSFYYTLPPDRLLRCSTVRFPVGILRPDWMEGASYVGQQMVGPFLCNVWTKVDFITYYEDVHTKRPVHWVFTTTGRSIHVMTFEVGAVLDDGKWQAPAHCFDGGSVESRSSQKSDESLSLRNLNLREGFKIAS